MSYHLDMSWRGVLTLPGLAIHLAVLVAGCASKVQATGPGPAVPEASTACDSTQDRAAWLDCSIDLLAADMQENGHAPGTMLELAELYHERGLIEAGLDDGTIQVVPLGEQAQTPAAPSLEAAITTLQLLLIRYPEYERLDDVYSLLGLCYNALGESTAALFAWLGFACPNLEPYIAGRGLSDPDRPAETEGWTTLGPYGDCTPLVAESDHLQSAWLHIGEVHFDTDSSPQGLERAIAAYTLALESRDEGYVDVLLYKLAWSYWRRGDYRAAIGRFAELLDLPDGDSALEPEALQYIALSFWEPDWDGDGQADPVTGLQRLQDPEIIDQEAPWLGQVYLALGQAYLDNAQNAEAIDVYEALLAHPGWKDELEDEVERKLEELSGTPP